MAAPIGTSKLYSLHLWDAATSSYDRVMAIEEPEIEGLLSERNIPSVHYSWQGKMPEGARHRMCSGRFNAAWEAILAYSDHPYILSLESDVIPKGDILTAMLQEWKTDDEILRQVYPWGGNYKREGKVASEMGCTLGTREAFRKCLDWAEEHDSKLYMGVLGQVCKSRICDVMEMHHLTERDV